MPAIPTERGVGRKSPIGNDSCPGVDRELLIATDHLDADATAMLDL
jgi:hypothetical protein